jgi:hypothetical protein
MATGTAHANEYLQLIYNGTAIANIADNAAASPLANIFIRAHSADPGAGGNQSTNEIAYTGYAAASVARTTGGFTAASGVLSLVADASFGACTAGTATAMFWSSGVASTGATKILHYGVFGSRQGPFTAVVSGNAFTIPAHTLIVNDRIAFYATNNSSLPGGVTSGTAYFVISVTGDVVTVSATLGGASITVSSAGDGLAYRIAPIAISAGQTPKLGAGQLAVIE